MVLPRSTLFSSPPAVANMKPPIMIIMKAKVPIKRLRILIALRIRKPAGEVPASPAWSRTLSSEFPSSRLKMSNTSKLDESFTFPVSANAKGALTADSDRRISSEARKRFIWRDLTCGHYTDLWFFLQRWCCRRSDNAFLWFGVEKDFVFLIIFI